MGKQGRSKGKSSRGAAEARKLVREYLFERWKLPRVYDEHWNPDYRFAFDVARAVQGQILTWSWTKAGRVDDQCKLDEFSPEDFAKVVTEYAQHCIEVFGLSIDPEQVLVHFHGAWSKVDIPEGQDDFSLALRAVKENEQEPAFEHSSSHVVLVAGMCRELQRRHPDDDIILPVKMLGRLLGVSPVTISNIRQVLEQNGVIRKTADYVIGKDENGKIRDRKATRFRYIPTDQRKPKTDRQDKGGLTRTLEHLESTNLEDGEQGEKVDLSVAKHDPSDSINAKRNRALRDLRQAGLI